MSDNEGNKGEEVLDKSIGVLKKLHHKYPNLKVIAYLIGFLSAGGGGTFLWVWDKAQDHIITVATPEIIHISDSIAHSKIEYVMDSIKQSNKNKVRLGSQLSSVMDVKRDSLHYKIGDWYNDEKNVYQIGLFGNKKTGRVLYRHTNGDVYRAIFKADMDYYYYYDDNGRWKQVK